MATRQAGGPALHRDARPPRSTFTAAKYEVDVQFVICIWLDSVQMAAPLCRAAITAGRLNLLVARSSAYRVQWLSIDSTSSNCHPRHISVQCPTVCNSNSAPSTPNTPSKVKTVDKESETFLKQRNKSGEADVGTAAKAEKSRTLNNSGRMEKGEPSMFSSFLTIVEQFIISR